eukprot:gene22860-30033_t
MALRQLPWACDFSSVSRDDSSNDGSISSSKPRNTSAPNHTGDTVYVINQLPDKDMTAIIKKNLLLDTLDMTRRFEKIGLTRDMAEELTGHITEVIISNKEKLEDFFVNKYQLDKVLGDQEAKITSFRTELQKSADMNNSSMLKDLDRQQAYLEKMRAEVKHEIDKLSASQRIDLNLEKGRMRDDIQLMRDKGTELEIRVDRDINVLKSELERAKNDTIKSVITILGTFSAIAFTISRLTGLS